MALLVQIALLAPAGVAYAAVIFVCKHYSRFACAMRDVDINAASTEQLWQVKQLAGWLGNSSAAEDVAVYDDPGVGQSPSQRTPSARQLPINSFNSQSPHKRRRSSTHNVNTRNRLTKRITMHHKGCHVAYLLQFSWQPTH